MFSNIYPPHIIEYLILDSRFWTLVRINKTDTSSIPPAKPTKKKFPSHPNSRKQFTHTSKMTTITKTSFFSSKRVYMVLGASSNPKKFGNKVLRWYINHSLPVYPVNPNLEKVCDIKAFKTPVAALSFYLQDSNLRQAYPDGFSISVITSPTVTLALLNGLHDWILKTSGTAGGNGEDKIIKSIWFQPGSIDEEVLKFVEENYGLSATGGSLIYSSPHEHECILVDGDDRLRNEIPEHRL
ncbi:unnamed protein product [Ambrosiozyma monospora]|uniref:Unnamed protein product n=1 Tax=Ambrosiozyma monospora TaxID=43982 RepID=A0A9W7DBZ3_AMBMO|nr:unnamed protein product [Ambrosiozyma monospora]